MDYILSDECRTEALRIDLSTLLPCGIVSEPSPTDVGAWLLITIAIRSTALGFQSHFAFSFMGSAITYVRRRRTIHLIFQPMLPSEAALYRRESLDDSLHKEEHTCELLFSHDPMNASAHPPKY